VSITPDRPASFVDVRAARYALAVLTFINLFNYLDRWVVAAVVESIKRSELQLTDTQLGLVGTGFILSYTLTSPFFGSLGDRRARPPLIALGVALWSIATALAGFARGFGSLFTARSAVGIGESAYGTIAPALLADFSRWNAAAGCWPSSSPRFRSAPPLVTFSGESSISISDGARHFGSPARPEFFCRFLFSSCAIRRGDCTMLWPRSARLR
jgi:MFS family permease